MDQKEIDVVVFPPERVYRKEMGELLGSTVRQVLGYNNMSRADIHPSRMIYMDIEYRI